MTKQSRSSGFTVAVLSSLVLASGLALWSTLPGLRPQSPLFGRRLTISSPLPHDEILSRLAPAGITDVVAPSTTEVFLSRIGRIEQVPLSEIDALLDPLDPRRDAYMQSLWTYFVIDGRNVVYADVPGPMPQQTVRRALGPQTRVEESDEVYGWVAALLLLIAAVVSLASEPMFPVRRLLMYAPAAGVAFLAGTGVAVALILALVAIDWTACSIDLDRSARDRQVRSVILASVGLSLWVVIMLIVATVYALSFVGLNTLIPFAAALIGGVSLRLLPAVVVHRSVLDEGHQRFSPVRIFRRSFFAVGGSSGRYGLLLIVVVLCAPIGIDRMIASRSAVRPVQLSEVGDAFTFPVLSELNRSSLHDDLPNVADYVAHRAFQDSFLYGAEYRFPDPEEPVLLDTFTVDESGAFSLIREPVLVFDAAWLAEAIGSPPPGIAELLTALDGPVSVGLQRKPLLFGSVRRLMIHLGLTAALGIPWLVRSVPGKKLMRRAGILRSHERAQQVA